MKPQVIRDLFIFPFESSRAGTVTHFFPFRKTKNKNWRHARKLEMLQVAKIVSRRKFCLNKPISSVHYHLLELWLLFSVQVNSKYLDSLLWFIFMLYVNLLAVTVCSLVRLIFFLNATVLINPYEVFLVGLRCFLVLGFC